MKITHSHKLYGPASLEAKYQRKLRRCITGVQGAMEMIENCCEFNPKGKIVGPDFLLQELRAALKKALDSTL